MNEEEKKPEEEKSLSHIDEANKAADRLKRENDRKEELLEKEEALAVENKLGGKADAGEVEPKKKEDTPEEYAEKLFKGEVNPAADDGIDT